MSMLSLEALRELVPGYVMDTLSDSELAAFESALADMKLHAELESEIAMHRAAIESPDTQAPGTQAPGTQTPGTQAPGTQTPGTQTPGTPSAARSAPSVSPRRSGGDVPVERRAVRVTPPHMPVVRNSSARPAWITAGVLGLTMVALLIFALTSRTQAGDVQTQLTQQQLVVQRLSERLAERDKTINALTSTENDVLVVTLVANEPVGPRMRVFWNRRTGEAVVRATNFTQIPDTRTYVLWMIRDGKPESLQLFRPDALGGSLMNTVALPRDPAGITAFSVTEEPVGGSPQPTMPPVLIGQVKTGSE